MPDPHDAPKDETPGERRARLMNLNNEGWHPDKVDKVDKVDEVPPAETSTIVDDPKPKLVETKAEAEKPAAKSQPARDQK